jgi:hypothetical protein
MTARVGDGVEDEHPKRHRAADEVIGRRNAGLPVEEGVVEQVRAGGGESDSGQGWSSGGARAA